MSHKLSIVNHGRKLHMRAECSCGWVGPWRGYYFNLRDEIETAAVEDGTDHVCNLP